jgi:hypothetical protein
MLFRVRYEEENAVDRERFLSSRNFSWIPVSMDFSSLCRIKWQFQVTSEEKMHYQDQLLSMYHKSKNDSLDAFDKEKFYKVRIDLSLSSLVCR